MQHAQPLLRSLLAAALLALGLPAMAQSVADPTRPPAVLSAPQPGSAASGVAHVASAPAPVVLQRVQSVQVPREGRASALVNDRLVFVGDKVGAATVIAIDAQGLQLRSAKGSVERLPLLDAQVVKQTVLPVGSAPAPVASLAVGKQP